MAQNIVEYARELSVKNCLKPTDLILCGTWKDKINQDYFMSAPQPIIRYTL